MIDFPVSRGTLGYCPREHHPAKNRDSGSLAITAWRHRDLPTHLTRSSLCPGFHNPTDHTHTHYILPFTLYPSSTIPPITIPSFSHHTLLTQSTHFNPSTTSYPIIPYPLHLTLVIPYLQHVTLYTLYPTHSIHQKPSSTSP